MATIVAASLSGGPTEVAAQAAVPLDADDIAGVVTGPRGPEAGVWVIAESKDQPTTLRKIVATDDQGRYLVPDLPKGNYDVWVRGYGLVDSAKVAASPGKAVNLKAVAAPNPKAAAGVLPGAVLVRADASAAEERFPGTGPSGNGISPNIKSQGEWIRQVVSTDGCTGCHQLGNKATREIPTSLGTFESSADAWDRRIQAGQAGGAMSARVHAGRPKTRARDVRRLDRSGRQRQAARDRAALARKARSATSSSRCGTGPIRRSICTTRSAPTNAIRSSTRTDRSTARSKRAPITCRSWIRGRTPRRRSS